MESASLAGTVVLIVEDHPDLRDVFKIWLERAGARVRVAGNGAEALGVLESGLAPDVIVCDLHMPGMDGCAFLSQVKEHAGFGSIPVIAVTGSLSDNAMMRTLEAGFDAHLVKPVTGDALQAQIGRVLGR